MEQIYRNPLNGVYLGSTIDDDNIFSDSVVDKNISIMVPIREQMLTLTGNSSLASTDSMNEGSLSIAGSYGLSATSKVGIAVKGNYGTSSASSGKSISTKYNAVSLEGVQLINFDNLTVGQLIASLESSPKKGILESLDCYNDLIDKLDGRDLNKAIEEKDAEVIVSLNDLTTSVLDFLSKHGTGLVVAIAWGGLGCVELNLTEKSSSSSWKYSFSSNLSYSKLGSSISVGQTYSGSSSEDKADVEVTVSAYSVGSSMAPKVKEWSDKFINKSFDELFDVKVIEKAPSMNIEQGPPEIPEFDNSITPDKTTVKKLEKIANLSPLQQVASRIAYAQAKKSDSKLSYEDFLAYAGKDNNVGNLQELVKKVETNTISVLKKQSLNRKLSAQLGTLRQAKKVTDDLDTSAYTPLGVWICPWSNIFPWIAVGLNNVVEDSASTDVQLRFRTMIQDFQTLSRIYYMVDNSNAIFPLANQIAIAFQVAANEAKDEDASQENINKLFKSLGKDAQSIYEKWDDTPALRNSELGLCLLRDGRSISPEDFGLEGYFPLKKTIFDPEIGNYAVLSSFVKLVPLITPDQKILAFGPGVLSEVGSQAVQFSQHIEGALEFEYDDNLGAFVNAETHMYSVPYSAAKSETWRGISVSTNLGSMFQLKNQLNDLISELSQLKNWSLSSEYWSPNWNPSDPYSLRTMGFEYLGVVKEPKNILPTNSDIND